ncbi:hypothetical protein CCMSSC00406_0009792 [Pleurotus cornucopiae]|uniref:Uncharacterized protein n=1 Tax=Pleurotus cornucopiae TaxID=5321 RepID=A0ACB7IIA6_PLECO|nr:hypothetical protein CCMSSC00406_0009792 [Pleurotus cornucopiae]
MDLQWGYNNVRIKEGDQWKAAFQTPRGAFKPMVMYFGLSNSPSTFQTMMNELFKDLIDEGLVVIYLDDLLIFTDNNVQKHREVVRRVLKILEDNNLYVKPEKCAIEVNEVEFLGVVVKDGEVQMEEAKIEAVKNWPVPRNVQQVQQFLGFSNYYRRFIKDFATVAKPLHELTKKEEQFVWNEKRQGAFEKLKTLFTEEPILVLPDTDREMKIEADSSNYASGAVLSMLCEDERWRPCAFLSKGFLETKRNYDIHDKEMLAIIRALEAWRHYLEGNSRQFTIWTDHKNLEYFMTTKKLNRRQARWALYLSRFNFILKHKPGASNMKADVLSRRPDLDRGEDDNTMVLLKPEYFRIKAMQQGHVLIDGAESPILSKIRKSKNYDESVVKAVTELKRSPTKVLREAEWSEEQDLVLYHGKVYVPKDVDIRREIVKLHHDSTVAGHPGRWKTIELVSRNYWWPGMNRFIAEYVKGCDQCQRSKAYSRQPQGKLQPNPIPSEPWTDISADFIVKLPKSAGYDAILVVIDRFTKMVRLVPTTKELSALGLAKLYQDNVWKIHGLPNTIISDQGPQFTLQVMRELNNLLGIQTRLSTGALPHLYMKLI